MCYNNNRYYDEKEDINKQILKPEMHKFIFIKAVLTCAKTELQRDE